MEPYLNPNQDALLRQLKACGQHSFQEGRVNVWSKTSYLHQNTKEKHENVFELILQLRQNNKEIYLYLSHYWVVYLQGTYFSSGSHLTAKHRICISQSWPGEHGCLVKRSKRARSLFWQDCEKKKKRNVTKCELILKLCHLFFWRDSSLQL